MADSPEQPPRPSIPGGPQRPQQQQPPERRWPLLILLGALLIAAWGWQGLGGASRGGGTIPYSDFYELVEKGQVKEVTIRGQRVDGKLKEAQQIDGRKVSRFSSVLPPLADRKLIPLLRRRKVEVHAVSSEPGVVEQLLSPLLMIGLFIGVWWWMGRRASKMMGGGPFGNLVKGRTKKFDKEQDITVTFDDVAGNAAAKNDLQEIVAFLKEPERFQRLGAKVPRGVLLVGPPGTGKTLVARAVAGEAGVPFFSINGSEFIEMFVGVGAARVRELFEEAKKVAPAIIFIDEIDAVGRARGAGLGGGHDEREQTLNQMLSEMDGFSRNDLTIVIAATNRPDVLDPALLRPGRFDRRVMVDRPEMRARAAILRVHMRGKPVDPALDVETLAAMTPGFSGADLANLVNEAALTATREGADFIGRDDFNAAYDKIVLGDPRETRLDPAEKHRVAIHEAGHAVVAHFSRRAEPLNRVSILPRGMALGVTQQTPAADRHIMTQKELESRLQVLMGGYAAESVVFDEVSSGAANDLERATDIAFKMIANYGMSEEVGPVFHDHKSEHPFLGQKVATDSGTSDATVHIIEKEMRHMLGGALDAAKNLIRKQRPAFDALVGALLEAETLEKETLLELLGPGAQSSASTPEPAGIH